jgi:16S rRNA processing protein RimM
VTAESRDTPSYLIVGRVRRAHGVRGEEVVQIMTEAPDAIFAPGARVVLGDTSGNLGKTAQELHVTQARPFKDGLLVHFREVPDRNAADLLRDRYLLVPEDEVDAPAEDEVFLHDLVGLVVEDRGTIVGTVTGYFESPAALLLEVDTGRGTILVPYRLEFIVAVDLPAKRLVLEAPEGMFWQGDDHD